MHSVWFAHEHGWPPNYLKRKENVAEVDSQITKMAQSVEKSVLQLSLLKSRFYLAHLSSSDSVILLCETMRQIMLNQGPRPLRCAPSPSDLRDIFNTDRYLTGFAPWSTREAIVLQTPFKKNCHLFIHLNLYGKR